MSTATGNNAEYEVIIVGVGFAGANIDCDLAMAGKSVLVVEAGPGLPKEP